MAAKICSDTRDKNKADEESFSSKSSHHLKRQHFKTVRFMFEAAVRLKADSLTLATAASFYHRFFRDFSTEEYDPYTISITCLYLASKVEEDSFRLTDVLNVCYRLLHPDRAPLDIDTTFWNLRETVNQCELFLTRALAFHLTVNHPHKYLMHYVKSLTDWLDQSTNDSVPIARTAMSLLRDSYHGDICIRYSPSLLAISVLYLTLECYGVKVPYNEDSKYEWWEALTDDIKLDDIKKCISELIDLYDLETTASS